MQSDNDKNKFNDIIKDLTSSLSDDSIENIIGHLSDDSSTKIEKQKQQTQNNEVKPIIKAQSSINDYYQSIAIAKEKEKDEKVAEDIENKAKASNKRIEEIKEKKEEKKKEIEQTLATLNKTEELIKKQNEFAETGTSVDPLRAMELIVSDTDYTEALLSYTDPKVAENQFKLFIIAQCKRELYKILEYSKMLDKIEERFKKVYIDRIDELSDGMLIRLMQIVLDKIDRGNTLINSVIKDKEITNILVINQQNNTVNNISELTKDKLLQTLYKASEDKAESVSASRAKVVEVVTEMFKDASDSEDEDDNKELLNNEAIDKALAKLQEKQQNIPEGMQGVEIIDNTNPDIPPIIIQQNEEQ